MKPAMEPLHPPDESGLFTPWPEPHRWPVTRRLLAYWRWTNEAHATGAENARRSVEARTEPLGVSVFEERPQ